MVQAETQHSRRTPEPPPPEFIINTTLDPTGRAVLFSVETRFRPEQIADFRSVFVTKHAIADEIERLLAVLDALDGDPDLEMNVNGDDPRLDDAEGDDADAEPSLAIFGMREGCSYFLDCEDDPAESGIGDLDGLAEQHGRAA